MRAGVQQPLISKIESGSRTPPVDTLVRILSSLRAELVILIDEEVRDSNTRPGRASQEGADPGTTPA